MVLNWKQEASKDVSSSKFSCHEMENLAAISVAVVLPESVRLLFRASLVLGSPYSTDSDWPEAAGQVSFQAPKKYAKQQCAQRGKSSEVSRSQARLDHLFEMFELCSSNPSYGAHRILGLIRKGSEGDSVGTPLAIFRRFVTREVSVELSPKKGWYRFYVDLGCGCGEWCPCRRRPAAALAITFLRGAE